MGRVVRVVVLFQCMVLDGMRLAGKRGCKFIEVSAFLDHRVDELLAGVVAQVRLRQLAVSHRPIAEAEAAATTAHQRPPGGGRCRRMQRLIAELWSRWTGRCIITCSENANNAVSNCDNLFLLWALQLNFSFFRTFIAIIDKLVVNIVDMYSFFSELPEKDSNSFNSKCVAISSLSAEILNWIIKLTRPFDRIIRHLGF